MAFHTFTMAVLYFHFAVSFSSRFIRLPASTGLSTRAHFCVSCFPWRLPYPKRPKDFQLHFAYTIKLVLRSGQIIFHVQIYSADLWITIIDVHWIKYWVQKLFPLPYIHIYPRPGCDVMCSYRTLYCVRRGNMVFPGSPYRIGIWNWHSTVPQRQRGGGGEVRDGERPFNGIQRQQFDIVPIAAKLAHAMHIDLAVVHAQNKSIIHTRFHSTSSPRANSCPLRRRHSHYNDANIGTFHDERQKRRPNASRTKEKFVSEKWQILFRPRQLKVIGNDNRLLSMYRTLHRTTYFRSLV